MNKYKISLLLQCLIFLIPLNIYMWGDWLLVNLQWALFRYQQSPYGNSFIFGYKDVIYIYLGQSTGLYNIAAALFWTIGAAILFIGFIFTIIAYAGKEFYKLKTASYFTIGGGIFLGLSALCRFNAGFAIPVGIPIILVIGWWMYREQDDPSEREDEMTANEPGPE
jgi:hypothetical protein